MSTRLRPGRIVRSTLALLAFIFLPLACWFLWSDWRRYWPNALGLGVVSALFLRAAVDRRPGSWMSIIDDIGGPANPDVPR